MFFLILLILAMHNTAYSSMVQPRNNDDPITITFSDGEPTSALYGEVKYFNTINNVLELYPSGKEIPVDVVKKPFDCLLKLLKPYKDKPKSLKLDEPLKLREKIKSELDTQECKDISKYELLQINDHLDGPQELTSALASFIAQKLYDTTPDDVSPLLESPIIQWLLHYAIADATIKGTLTSIPVGKAYRPPIFINSKILWTEQEENKFELLSYDFLRSKLPQKVTTFYYDSNSPAYLSTKNNDDGFCICGKNQNNWRCKLMSKSQAEPLDTIEFAHLPNKLRGIVYNAHTKNFVAIFERSINIFTLYPIVENPSPEDIVSITTTTNLSLAKDYMPRPYTRYWTAIDHYFVRSSKDFDSAENPILIYDTVTKNVIFEGKINDYAQKDDPEINFIQCYEYDVNSSKRVSRNQFVPKATMIPAYNKIMSTRASAESVKNMLDKWPYTFNFDPTSMCYIGLENATIGKNSLLVYSLLPHELKAMIDLVKNEFHTLKNPLLSIWYGIQAARKTKLWKTLSKQDAKDIDPRIVKLYPLHPSSQEPQNLGMRASIAASLKYNLGALQQKANYIRYVYGNFLTVTAVGLGIGALALAYLLSPDRRKYTITNRTDSPIKLTTEKGWVSTHNPGRPDPYKIIITPKEW